MTMFKRVSLWSLFSLQFRSTRRESVGKLLSCFLQLFFSSNRSLLSLLSQNHKKFYVEEQRRTQQYLPKHEFLSPNNQFYQRIWHAEHYSVRAYMAWSHKFRKSEILFDTGPRFVSSVMPKNMLVTHDILATTATFSSLALRPLLPV